MFPSALVSTYQQYKQDTNSIAAWLASTEKSVGFPPDLITLRVLEIPFIKRDYFGELVAFSSKKTEKIRLLTSDNVVQMGTSAAAMSSRRRKSTSLFSKSGPRGLNYPAPVQTMFTARYVDGSGEFDLTPEHVDSIIELSQYENEGNEEEGTFILGQIGDPEKLEEKKKSWQSQKEGRRPRRKAVEGGRMAPEQLITPLILAFHAETLEFSFPYLQMHRWCWKVLRFIKESCGAVLRGLYTPAYIERENELPFVVGWALMAASGLDGGISDIRPLQLAAEALNNFLETSASSFVCTEVLSKTLGLPVQFVVEGEGEDGA